MVCDGWILCGSTVCSLSPKRSYTSGSLEILNSDTNNNCNCHPSIVYILVHRLSAVDGISEGIYAKDEWSGCLALWKYPLCTGFGWQNDYTTGLSNIRYKSYSIMILIENCVLVMCSYVSISFRIKTLHLRQLQNYQHVSKLLDRPWGICQLVLFDQKTPC